MSQVELRPYIDGNIPARGATSRLLQLGRADVEVRFIELVGAGSVRAYYPVESDNEIVAPSLPGVYRVGVVCPAVLGADGRVATIYPPVSVDIDVDDSSTVIIGDATQWQIDETVEAKELAGSAQDAAVAASKLAEAHGEHLGELDVVVDATKGRLDSMDVVVAGMGDDVASAKVDVVSALTDAGSAVQVANLAKELSEGLVSLAAEPPSDPPVGQVWVPTNDAGQATGLWRWNGSAWETVANLVGLLMVPTADGGMTLIGPDGVEATQVVAEMLRTDVLYADVAGVKTLVITDIPRESLAEDVGEALATAESLGSRILIDGALGTLTIARNRPNPGDPLTATIMSATSLDFVVADKSVAYIDSEREQMSITNVLVRDSLQVGAHLVRTIPGSGITNFQRVAEVN